MPEMVATPADAPVAGDIAIPAPDMEAELTTVPFAAAVSAPIPDTAPAPDAAPILAAVFAPMPETAALPETVPKAADNSAPAPATLPAPADDPAVETISAPSPETIAAPVTAPVDEMTVVSVPKLEAHAVPKRQARDDEIRHALYRLSGRINGAREVHGVNPAHDSRAVQDTKQDCWNGRGSNDYAAQDKTHLAMRGNRYSQSQVRGVERGHGQQR
jgi:hypothetical protein